MHLHQYQSEVFEKYCLLVIQQLNTYTDICDSKQFSIVVDSFMDVVILNKNSLTAIQLERYCLVS